jgi:RNA polymerase sigma-70 factor (ECF subfamily)
MDWITTSTILSDLRDNTGRAAGTAAWEQFVSRFRPGIVRFALKLGLPADAAEETAQDALLAFAEQFRKGEYDRNRGRLSHWLFGIAYRQALRQRAAAARRPAGVAAQSFWHDLPDERSAMVSWDMEWEQAVLEQCIERVRHEVEPATFHAFELAIMEGRSASEVAGMLQVSVKMVYNAKHRVLKRIRELRALLENAEP